MYTIPHRPPAVSRSGDWVVSLAIRMQCEVVTLGTGDGRSVVFWYYDHRTLVVGSFPDGFESVEDLNRWLQAPVVVGIRLREPVCCARSTEMRAFGLDEPRRSVHMEYVRIEAKDLRWPDEVGRDEADMLLGVLLGKPVPRVRRLLEEVGGFGGGSAS